MGNAASRNVGSDCKLNVRRVRLFQGSGGRDVCGLEKSRQALRQATVDLGVDR